MVVQVNNVSWFAENDYRISFLGCAILICISLKFQLLGITYNCIYIIATLSHIAEWNRCSELYESIAFWARHLSATFAVRWGHVSLRSVTLAMIPMKVLVARRCPPKSVESFEQNLKTARLWQLPVECPCTYAFARLCGACKLDGCIVWLRSPHIMMHWDQFHESLFWR